MDKLSKVTMIEKQGEGNGKQEKKKGNMKLIQEKGKPVER